jgi:hypothetical protein
MMVSLHTRDMLHVTCVIKVGQVLAEIRSNNLFAVLSKQADGDIRSSVI